MPSIEWEGRLVAKVLKRVGNGDAIPWILLRVQRSYDWGQKELFLKLLSPLWERRALYKRIGNLFCKALVSRC